MAADARRQCRHDGAPLRRDPAFAAIADHPAAQHQVLHDEILVSLEPRSGRGSRLKGLFLDTDPWRRLATSPTLVASCGGFGAVPFSMPLGLIFGRPFKPFSRAISSRCSATMRSSSVTLPSSFTTSSCSSPCDRPDISGGAVTRSLNRAAPRRSKQKITPRPGFCPGYSETT